MSPCRILLFRTIVVAFILAGLAAPPRAALAQGIVPADGRDPRIEKLLSQVSEQRVADTLKKLGSFATRNTLSSTDSPTTGIGAARQWIFDEMKKSSARLQVSFDSYQVPKSGRITRDIELRNVMAVLPGKSARRVYISAHYDSFARRVGRAPCDGGRRGRARRIVALRHRLPQGRLPPDKAPVPHSRPRHPPDPWTIRPPGSTTMEAARRS